MRVMTVDISRCRGEYECVRICPVEAIEVCGQYPCCVYPEECLQCGSCEEYCTSGALKWVEQDPDSTH